MERYSSDKDARLDMAMDKYTNSDYDHLNSLDDSLLQSLRHKPYYEFVEIMQAQNLDLAVSMYKGSYPIMKVRELIGERATWTYLALHNNVPLYVLYETVSAPVVANLIPNIKYIFKCYTTDWFALLEKGIRESDLKDHTKLESWVESLNLFDLGFTDLSLFKKNNESTEFIDALLDENLLDAINSYTGHYPINRWQEKLSSKCIWLYLCLHNQIPLETIYQFIPEPTVSYLIPEIKRFFLRRTESWLLLERNLGITRESLNPGTQLSTWVEGMRYKFDDVDKFLLNKLKSNDPIPSSRELEEIMKIQTPEIAIGYKSIQLRLNRLREVLSINKDVPLWEWFHSADEFDSEDSKLYNFLAEQIKIRSNVNFSVINRFFGSSPASTLGRNKYAKLAKKLHLSQTDLSEFINKYEDEYVDFLMQELFELKLTDHFAAKKLAKYIDTFKGNSEQ